jgi:hypothetical protein
MLVAGTLVLIALLHGSAQVAQAATTAAQAQTPAAPSNQNDPLEPDRPDVTNGPHLVDIGVLQVEVGGVWSRIGSHRHSTGTPITARVGLTDWLEARVGGDGYLTVTDPNGHESGIGNVQIGAKVRLWADPGGVSLLSVLPGINLPAASEREGLGSGQADFTVAILTGTDFLTHGHLDINYGVGWIGAGTGLPRFTQHVMSVSASLEVPGPVTPYLESFWFSRQGPDGGPAAAVDSGAIYVISPRFALDGGVQLGLTDAAPSLSGFGGISVVLGNVLGERGVHARQRQTARRRAHRAAPRQ